MGEGAWNLILGLPSDLRDYLIGRQNTTAKKKNTGGGVGQIKGPGKEKVGVEFPDFSGKTCPTHQNPSVKQTKEEAIETM